MAFGHAAVAIAGPLILRDATVRSGARLEQAARVSLAVRDGRIAAIGALDDTRRATAGARELDLAGALVLPGFVDSHTHLGWAGEGMWRVSWEDVAERATALERVRIVARRIDPGFWITGGGWDRAILPDDALPERRELDALTGDAPLFLVSEDRSSAVANTRALALFRIGGGTPDPPDDGVERDAAGSPTGRLSGRVARGRMTAEVVPPPDRHRRLAELRAAIRELNRHGVTEAHDIASYPSDGPTPLAFSERGFTDASLYHELADRSELTIRVSVRPYLGRSADAALRRARHDERIRCHGVKMIIDDGRYSEGPPGRYEFRYPGYDTTLAWMREADRAGLDVTLHGLGDAAVTEALDLFEALAASEPPRSRRQRLVHARRIAPADIVRIARLGVVVEAQPYDLLAQMPALARRFSAEFLATAYPFADLLAAGARVAFGSDWRITPQRPDLRDMDALQGILAAVTRAEPGGEVWQPAQRIGVPDAIRCYTEQAVWADHAEERRGAIRVGNDADLVVLSDDVVGAAERLVDARVAMTVVRGDVVFDRGIA